MHSRVYAEHMVVEKFVITFMIFDNISLIRY